jgi:glycine/D-amino acid oxidase-like deaminating enzyme
VSLWHDQVGRPPPRPALPGDTAVDVAIVGAGYTGLWTAWYLKQQDPALRVVVVEKEVAGFGASGRNGGWCSALFPTSWPRMARASSRPAVVAMQAALEDAVDEVGRSGLACDFAKGGSVALARSPAQLARARAAVAQARAWGFGPDTRDLVSAAEASRRVGATHVLGAVTTAHCAALHPARLVRALAAGVEDLGVPVHEQTAALRVGPGRVVTTHGTVRAEVVLPATEGYTAQLPGHRRDLAPVYSLMLATEPLPDDVWAQLGLHDRATFTDERHLTVYGQRTADGRIAFGGRGAPYHFGSRVDPSYDVVPRVHAALERALVELFPVLRGVTITHRWGGNLGVPRDWFPAVGLDRRTGLAWAGGYVGDGVAASNLAGRTLADLVLGRDTERTRLPWVRRRTRKWEPEPLRWLGVNGVTRLMTHADRSEARSGRPSRAAALFWRTR